MGHGIARSAEGLAILRDWHDRFRARLRVEVEDRTVSTEHGETHLLLAGRPDAPPVVLLHGAMASSAHVLGESERLAERFRLIVPDIVGHSPMSAPDRPDVRGDAYGRWLWQALDGLGVARASIYAASWGGLVALRAVEAAPGRVEALVLLCPAGVVRGTLFDGIFRAALPLAAYRLAPTPARLRRLLRHQLTTLDDDWAPYLGDAILHSSMDFRLPPNTRAEAVAGFGGPVYVLAADDDVHFPGPPLLARARELFPRAVTELLPGSKHAPPTDEAGRAALCGKVGAFLEAALVAGDATDA